MGLDHLVMIVREPKVRRNHFKAVVYLFAGPSLAMDFSKVILALATLGTSQLLRDLTESNLIDFRDSNRTPEISS